MRRQRTSQGREWGREEGRRSNEKLQGKRADRWEGSEGLGGAAGRRTVREKMDDENVR